MNNLETYVEGMGITNKYVKKFLTKYCPNFRNVFCSDELKNLKLENGYYVINLATKFSNSGHFVALLIKNHEILYFDPFGLRPILDSIIDLLNNDESAQVCAV